MIPSASSRSYPGFFPRPPRSFVEGTAISSDVMSCYERHRELGEHLPGRQTFLPPSKRFRCTLSPILCDELAKLSSEHAGRELLDHLFLYAESRCLLCWHDAFANVVYLSEAVPEASVAALASAFSVKYRKLG